MTSWPDGLEDIAYRTIARPLLQRIEELSGTVHFEVLRPPTLSALKTKIKAAVDAKRPYHIVHFDGHGEFRPAPSTDLEVLLQENPDYSPEKSYLLFERIQGGKEYVSANEFASIISGGKVPLVVLNACKSGAIKNQINSAIATCLIQQGVGSVVAMAYSIYVSAAADFMKEFYNVLLSGDAVSKAITAGREQLYTYNERTSLKGPLTFEDWMVPVHYTRRDLKIVELKKKDPTRALRRNDLLKRSALLRRESMLRR